MRSRLLGSWTLLLLSACTDARAGDTAPPVDIPLDACRRELLDLAYRTASALPRMPHIKTRSLAQVQVVEACLMLDQPQRALEYARGIDNWRRGEAYAEYALYCARKGHTAAVQRHLDFAREVYEKAKEDEMQDWQRDRIRATIAHALRRLGRAEEAASFESGLVDSESGAAATDRGMAASPEAFDAILESVDAVVARGDFDQVRNALGTCAGLFDRYHADAERRSKAEAKIKASWGKLPIMVRVEIMLGLTECALDHGDAPGSLALAEETAAMITSATWQIEHRIPLEARLAEARLRAGAAEQARKQLDDALAAYESGREAVGNIYRAGVLRPLAEAYAALGDADSARKVYARAVEEGVVNPNSRPRAEDLSATCSSMAVAGVEPDEELRSRLETIFDGLGDPW